MWKEVALVAAGLLVGVCGTMFMGHFYEEVRRISMGLDSLRVALKDVVTAQQTTATQLKSLKEETLAQIKKLDKRLKAEAPTAPAEPEEERPALDNRTV